MSTQQEGERLDELIAQGVISEGAADLLRKAYEAGRDAEREEIARLREERDTAQQLLRAVLDENERLREALRWIDEDCTAIAAARLRARRALSPSPAPEREDG